MDEQIEEIKRKMKQKRINYTQNSWSKKEKNKRTWSKQISKFLITIVLTLITIIILKGNTQIKTQFYKYIYETNFNFATINNWYQKKFGTTIPFQKIFQTPTQTVFNEKITYKKINDYENGAVLEVSTEYLVPIIESGIVVFIGEKENYGNTIIIQQINGIDTWYGNINANVSMYDYVEKGSLLGNCINNKLYIQFQKNGEPIDYNEYI